MMDKNLIYKLQACKGSVSVCDNEAEYLLAKLEELEAYERAEKLKAWVVRDSDKPLFLFLEKPTKDNGVEIWKGSVAVNEFAECLQLPMKMLKQIKWEDAEPTEVEMIIKLKQ